MNNSLHLSLDFWTFFSLSLLFLSLQQQHHRSRHQATLEGSLASIVGMETDEAETTTGTTSLHWFEFEKIEKFERKDGKTKVKSGIRPCDSPKWAVKPIHGDADYQSEYHRSFFHPSKVFYLPRMLALL